MEIYSKYIKKIRIWNLITLVLASIGTIFSIIGLPAALSPDKTLYKDLGLEGMSIYNQLNSMPVKVFTVLNVLFTIAFVILFFISHRKIKKDQIPLKYPYYLNLGWTVVSIIFSLLTTPSFTNTSETQSMGLIIGITNTIFTLVFKLPIIMVLVYLFKVNTGENDIEKVN
ncbi:hypothetical protein SHT65_08990 [Enterococcus faecalis]|uniref:hypothetical protein n=1 Tax=Enterococcus faecalis TaxID=1351 RepID=UPI0029C81B9B|nr:hypothetical protein [Enterococcus faecalis]WPH36583.1 hypothetical protein SHT65_08990 [Enterococcus faecalis]